jgi:hypothetical protein
VGESTKGEIKYAMLHGKPVRYLIAKATPGLIPLSSGTYEYQGYCIRTSSSGGKAGKDNNRTASLQITEQYNASSYLLKKAYSFAVGDFKSFDRAEAKCIAWIISNPINKKNKRGN